MSCAFDVLGTYAAGNIPAESESSSPSASCPPHKMWQKRHFSRTQRNSLNPLQTHCKCNCHCWAGLLARVRHVAHMLHVSCVQRQSSTPNEKSLNDASQGNLNGNYLISDHSDCLGTIRINTHTSAHWAPPSTWIDKMAIGVNRTNCAQGSLKSSNDNDNDTDSVLHVWCMPCASHVRNVAKAAAANQAFLQALPLFDRHFNELEIAFCQPRQCESCIKY